MILNTEYWLLNTKFTNCLHIHIRIVENTWLLMTWPMFPKKPGAWRVSDSMKKFWCGRAWPVAVPSGFSAFSTKEHWVLQILSRLTASYPNSLISCGQLLIFRDWQWAYEKEKWKNFYDRNYDTQFRAVVSRGAGSALAPPEFGISVNPIPTRGGRLCPPHYC